MSRIAFTRWLNRLASDDLLAFLIGCSPSSLPPLGSYFDFINRLWLQNPAFERLGRKDLFPAHKNLKPSKKPSKGEKLPNRHSGITEIAVNSLILIVEKFIIGPIEIKSKAYSFSDSAITEFVQSGIEAKILQCGGTIVRDFLFDYFALFDDIIVITANPYFGYIFFSDVYTAGK